jgi:hypothetical protein
MERVAVVEGFLDPLRPLFPGTRTTGEPDEVGDCDGCTLGQQFAFDLAAVRLDARHQDAFAGEPLKRSTQTEEEEPEPEVDVDELFAVAGKKKGVKDLDAFWDDAIEKTGNLPINADVITFADAQKLGLKPGEAAIKMTGPLRSTGQLKKK